MAKLQLIKQPTDSSCALACISMLTHVPMFKVIDIAKSIFDHDPLEMGLNTQDMDHLMRKLDIKYTIQYPVSISFGNVYMVDVPSVNKMGRMHVVILDMRDEFEILDPQKGRPNRKYYVHGKPQNDLEVTLSAYANVLKIHGNWEK